MSLINRMLQELDARGSDGARGAVFPEVRAVPEQKKTNYLLWSLALLAAMLVGGAASWAWIRLNTVPLQGPPSELPLKVSAGLSSLDGKRAAAAETPPVAAAFPPPAPVAPPALMGAGTATPDVVPEQAPGAAVMETPAPPSTIAQVRPASAQARQRSGNDNASAAQADAAPSGRARAPAAPGRETAQPTDYGKQVKELTPQQRAENEFRRASSLASQGRINEAAAGFESALHLDPRHAAARQALVALLIEQRRNGEAVKRLQEGLALDPQQTGLAMILARLQVEHTDVRAAIDTLQRSLPHATDRADYSAFLAALLQRQGRNREAIEHYGAALRLSPQNGVWWMGIGISLQAESRFAEAREAFGRARATNSLTPELSAFVEQRLSQLPR